MAPTIPHQYCSDYNTNLSPEFCSLLPINPISEQSSQVFDININGGSMNKMVPFMSYDINSPVSSVGSFPGQFGVSDSSMVVPQLSEMENMGFCDNFAACDYQNQVFEPGEDHCTQLLPNFWPSYPMAAQNWAIQTKAATTKVEESEVKVGRYSVEERKDRILRYLKKRNQRNFNKTIKYACRKTLADKRVRVRGRFAKNNEPCEDEMGMNTTHIDHDTCYGQNNSFYEGSIQMKYDEDDWLQTAMANLMHFPAYT